MPPTKKQLFKLAALLLGLLLVVVSILIVYDLNKASINNELVNLDLLPKPEKLTELYFNNSANLPGSATGNLVAGTYIGTIDDVSSNVKTSLSLTGVQQSQGKITGYLVLGPGLQGSGPFSGTINENHLRLIVKDSAGHPSFLFEGVTQSTISMNGDFYRCSPISALSNQCSRQSKSHGIWNAKLVVNFAFVIHNLETTDYQYVYDVYVNASGSRQVIDSGNVLVKNNRYYVKNESFKPIDTSGNQEVVIELINKQQSIDFWIEN